ncbi:MAG: hypothetical protein RLZZ241_1808 [Bacteroidota bacterium]|jgi:ligand-binding SRPBCC domain-containing protein
MPLYRIISEQHLTTTLENAWEFLSDPENLSKITPDAMKFEIKGGAETRMFPGQIIRYHVSPFPGIRVPWITEITHVKEHQYFVDEQRFGPYKFWHHKHFITPTDQGVLMQDIVDYMLPGGPLGQLMHFLLVKMKLKGIFEFREKALDQMFGGVKQFPAKLTFIKLP